MLQKLFIFLTVASFFLNAQSLQNKSIEDYKSLLKSFDTNIRNLNINQDKIKNYAKLYYEVNTNDPIEFAKTKIKEVEQIKSQAKNKEEFSSFVQRSLKEKEIQLKKTFKNYFNTLEYNLLVTPIIIKARVIDKESRLEKIAKDSDITFTTQYLKVEVEDVIKAKRSIKKGSVLEIMYADHWANSQAVWNEGNTYLFLLGFRTDLTGSTIGIITYLDGDNFGYFPIEGGEVQDKNEFFNWGSPMIGTLQK